MNATAPLGLELNLHRLERPYAHTHLERPEQVRRLMHSLDAHGQQVPLAELTRVRRQLQHLARRLGGLLEPRPPPATWAALRRGVAHTVQALERLRQPLQEGEHVIRAPTPDDSPTAGQGPERAPDQPHPRTQPAQRAAGAQGGSRAAPEEQAARRERALMARGRRTKDRFKNNVNALGAFRSSCLGIAQNALDTLFLNVD